MTIRLGGGFLGTLGLIFVILKMTGNITWPWLWVLAPFWLPLAASLLVLLVALLVALAAVVFVKLVSKTEVHIHNESQNSSNDSVDIDSERS